MALSPCQEDGLGPAVWFVPSLLLHLAKCVLGDTLHAVLRRMRCGTAGSGLCQANQVLIPRQGHSPQGLNPWSLWDI
jgi:hypothetical protein